MKTFALLACAVCLTVTSAGQASSPSQLPGATQEIPGQLETMPMAVNAKSEVMQADADFNKATQERRLEGWMEYMADDVVLDRGGRAAVGKEAVRKELTPQWSDPRFKLTWKPDDGHVFESGDFGFSWGHWQLEAPAKDGSLQRRTGQYLTVWRKQKDGSWKVIWDGGAASPQAAGSKKAQ